MATVSGFTRERMLEIENTTIVDGEVQGDDLVLIRRDGVEMNVGNVRGPEGLPGSGGDTPEFFLEQVFAIATNPWVISIPTEDVRGLSIETYTTDGVRTSGTESKPDAHTIEIMFYYPMAGVVRVFS